MEGKKNAQQQPPSQSSSTLLTPFSGIVSSCFEPYLRHGCQMAIGGILDHMCLALRASGLWLRYATLQNLSPSFHWNAPPALHTGAIQGKEGIKFRYLATLKGSGENL